MNCHFDLTIIHYNVISVVMKTCTNILISSVHALKQYILLFMCHAITLTVPVTTIDALQHFEIG